MKKNILFFTFSILFLTACTSTNTNFKDITIIENEPQFLLEESLSTQKALEDIIVFNEEGVLIKKEGNNLILSMPEAILFDFDKYEVKDSVKGNLDILAKALSENSDIKLKIDGYTDFIGSDQYNLNLSLKRAQAIKEYLIYKGVIYNNISIEGYGKQNPIASNETDKGRAKNRRVEFIISRDPVIF